MSIHDVIQHDKITEAYTICNLKILAEFIRSDCTSGTCRPFVLAISCHCLCIECVRLVCAFAFCIRLECAFECVIFNQYRFYKKSTFATFLMLRTRDVQALALPCLCADIVIYIWHVLSISDVLAVAISCITCVWCGSGLDHVARVRGHVCGAFNDVVRTRV